LAAVAGEAAGTGTETADPIPQHLLKEIELEETLRSPEERLGGMAWPFGLKESQ
jgi:hypothetical protein